MEQGQELSGLIAKFNGEIKDAQDYREPFEQIWLAGYRAFYNTYDPEVKIRPGGSEVYYGLTRVKVNTAHNREADILFNRSTVPWTIQPTPIASVPMKGIVNFILEQVPEETAGLISYTGPARLMELLPKEIFLEAQQALAEKANIKMSKQIEDAWIEDKDTPKFKAAMLEKTICGAGILKAGTSQREISKWQAGAEEFTYTPKSIFCPSLGNVSLFDVLFDPGAKLMINDGAIEGCDYAHERHIYTRAQFHDLASKPMFDKAAIMRCLEIGSNYKETDSDRALRSIRTETSHAIVNRYEVWERTGYLTLGELDDAGIDTSQFETKNEDGKKEIDRFEIINMVVWFCGNEVIKAVIYPDRATRFPYFVCPQEYAPGELYGLGIPFKMRHSQQLTNAGIRLFIDTKANASGPVIVYNENKCEIKELREGLRPWGEIGLDLAPNEKVSDFYRWEAIPDVSGGMVPLIEMANGMAEEESGVMSIGLGAQSKAMARMTGGAASGMSMVMSSADLTNKSAVRLIDDYWITPIIEFYYNWYMQFGEDESLKGDMNVQALGTVGLMKKEVQSQRLVQLLTQAKIAPPVDPEVGHSLWMDTLESMDLDVSRFKSYDELTEAQNAGGGSLMEAMSR